MRIATRAAGLLVRIALVAWLVPQPATAQRLVAIGDIHGAYDELVTLLQAAELIDSDLDWSGGTAVLVQTGDFTDRGPGTRQIMDLLRKLQDQAAAAGGRAVVLMGNHEMMNLVGDMRDVSAETLAAWAEDTDTDRRNAAYAAAQRSAPQPGEARRRTKARQWRRGQGGLDDGSRPGLPALRREPAPHRRLRSMAAQPADRGEGRRHGLPARRA